jgi:hypothetical protein
MYKTAEQQIQFPDTSAQKMLTAEQQLDKLTKQVVALTKRVQYLERENARRKADASQVQKG